MTFKCINAQISSQASNSHSEFDASLKIWAFDPHCFTKHLIQEQKSLDWVHFLENNLDVGIIYGILDKDKFDMHAQFIEVDDPLYSHCCEFSMIILK